MNDILNTKIKDLNLSTKTYNALTRGIAESIKFETVGELIKADHDILIKIRNLGEHGIREAVNAVHMLGVKFDFELDPTNRYCNAYGDANREDLIKMYEVVCRKIKAKQKEIDEKQAELQELYTLKTKITILTERATEEPKKLQNVNTE